MNIRCPNCQTTFRVDPARVPAGGIRARCSRCAETFFVQSAATGGATRATPTAATSGTITRPPDSTSVPPAAERLTPAPPRAAAARPAAAAETPAPAAQTAPPAAATAERAEWGSSPAAAPSAAATAGRSAWSGGVGAPAAAAAERAAYAPPAPAAQSAASATAAPSYATPRPQPHAGGVGPAGSATAPAAGGQPSRPTEAPRPHTFGSRDPDARAMRIARALISDIIAYHPKRWESSRDGGTLRAEFREEIMKSWEEYVAQVGLELARSTPHFRNALNDILARGQQIF